MAKTNPRKPPFKGGTTEYVRWYARVRAQHKVEHPEMPWPEYYARAKAQATNKTPDITTKSTSVKLFGGALTPEYRAWYYRLQCEARTTGRNDWPEFFAAAKAEALRQQGGQVTSAPQNNPTPASPPLFGGASTPAYRQWYKALRNRARSLNIGDARWKSYFMQHKWDEMERQGLLGPQVQVKPHNVVPIKAVLARGRDERLMFDFTIAPPHHLVTDQP